MRTWLVTLPLLCMAGAAMGQENAGPAKVEAVQVQEQAPERKAKARPRQGADMRHCLDKQDSKAIIRCAEPGRKR